LAEGVVQADGDVQLARSADLTDPVVALRAAAAAAQLGLRLAPATVQRLALAPSTLDVPWPRAAREEFVSLLGAGHAALPIWEALDQSGLWAGWIPGWERLRALPQHSPVHRFTVDRHLVEAALQAAALTRRVHRPDLLLVGALLHDVGKGLPGDHTEQGVRLVEQLAADLGFGPADCSVLVDLCRLHLLLPDTATRRDLDDPATVTSAVTRLTQSSVASGAIDAHELLDLLTALTEADARATGPAAWTEWRAGLIKDLSERMAAQLRGESPAAMAGPSIEEQELLDRGPGVNGIEVVVEQRGPVWRIVVVANDRTGLMADVAGVLSIHRLAVRAATLHSSDNGALQVWTVQPVFGEPPEASRLREDLVRVQGGSLDLHGRLAARDASYRSTATPSAPPVVEVAEGASDRATVLEVRSHDRPALLHTIGWVLAEHGADIRAARVATMGSEAVDSFYVTDAQGRPLEADRAQEAVDAITSALALP
jgi:[protein-PII] uridylyltransferase